MFKGKGEKKFGVGVYTGYPISGFNGRKQTQTYMRWSSMLSRCYNVNNDGYPKYGFKGVTVCEEWFDFQEFAKWEQSQHVSQGTSYHLDKDILFKNNDLYSPLGCRLVPSKVNIFFAALPSKPVVKFQGKLYSTQPTLDGKKIYGGFRTELEAVNFYWEIKQLASLQLVDEFQHGVSGDIMEVMRDIRRWAES